VLDPKDCLKTHSRAQCEALAEAQQNAGVGKVLTPQNCTQVLTPEHCEALAQAAK